MPNAEDEYAVYHWPEYKEETVVKELPVKLNDHLMDCERMLTVGTMNIKIKEPSHYFQAQKVPHQDHWTPTKKVKEPKKWDAY